MSAWHLKFTVRTEGAGRWDYDRFGNEVWVPGPLEDVPVFSWAVVKTQEIGEDSVLRTIDDLEILAPPDTFSPEQSVTLPDGTVWQIQGNPEDINHNPYWAPGLVTYHARKTEG